MITPLQQARFPIELRCAGSMGTVVPIEFMFTTPYRVDLCYATDDAKPPASGTTIESIHVGRVQQLLPTPISTAAFLNEPLINTIARLAAVGLAGLSEELERLMKHHQITWPLIRAGDRIQMQVRFTTSCAFRMTLWGIGLRC